MNIHAQRASESQVPAIGHDAARPRTAVPPDALGASLNEGPTAKSLAQLRRTLDRSPRVQTQLALQRALNRNVFQRAKLNLRSTDATISGVSNWPHRPSSNVSGSQGQHLTAYVSFTDMILSHVRDRSVADAANELIGVLDRMQALPGGDYWYGQYGSTIETNKDLLRQAAKDDDAQLVGGVIDNILSLRNELPDTAIATSEQTWGHGESGTSGGLEVLETILRKGGGTLPPEYDAKTEADAALLNMWRLLDYQPTTGASSSAFDKTKNRVLRHVMQMRLSYPEVFAWLSARGSWLMPYIKVHRTDAGMPLSNLDGTEIDEITDHVHGNI